MRGIHPLTATDTSRRDVARDLLVELRCLERQVKDNEVEMRHAFADNKVQCQVCLLRKTSIR
ncbi:hypothetical protein SAMN05216532_0158 [Streptomyces sp. 2231.1]|nr:hypothetical protein SAMN05216532_0158 [Streptomyces sp. 2231.1]